MFKSFLSIFSESTNTFDGIENDERVLHLVREHPLVIIFKVLYLVPLAFLPLIIGVVFYSYIAQHELFNIFLFLSSIWILFLWQALFYSLTMYTLDVWIVTNKRIVDSTQHGFFKRIISELHLSRIQDTSVNTTGIIQTFFKYGNIEIQTAGNENRFKFDRVADPEGVRDGIMKAVLENRQV